jgi:hypothetical protein
MPAGRPEEGRKRSIILDDEDHALACEIGNGSFTRGVVAMIDAERENRGLPVKMRRTRKRSKKK